MGRLRGGGRLTLVHCESRTRRGSDDRLSETAEKLSRTDARSNSPPPGVWRRPAPPVVAPVDASRRSDEMRTDQLEVELARAAGVRSVHDVGPVLEGRDVAGVSEYDAAVRAQELQRLSCERAGIFGVVHAEVVAFD
jgi:hypothetical protein